MLKIDTDGAAEDASSREWIKVMVALLTASRLLARVAVPFRLLDANSIVGKLASATRRAICVPEAGREQCSLEVTGA